MMGLSIYIHAYDVCIDGIYYDLVNKTKTASVVSGDTKYSGSIVIPSIISYENVEYNVRSIGNVAFSYCNELTSVSIPNSVTSIGNSAFSDCHLLNSIELPNSVTSIGRGAFFNCESLHYFTIPDNVTDINQETFQNCSGLIEVTIPNGLVNIGNNAFYRCYNLTTIDFPTSVRSVGSESFSGCKRLNSVSIGDGVTSIGSQAFYNCTGLTDVTIPGNVTSIGTNAFQYCSNLSRVNVTSIEKWLELSMGSYFTYPYHLYLNNQEVNNLVIPNGVIEIGNYSFSTCIGITSVSIPNSVMHIGNHAFEGCTGLTTINIPNGVTEIEWAAFDGCSNLTSITLPGSITEINGFLFSGCSNLSSIVIPDGVTSIDGYAFSDCNNLSSVYIPKSVTSISNYAFRNCQELTDFFCYAKDIPEQNKEPFEPEYKLFEGSYIEYATLHVPYGSSSLYGSTSPWSEFGTIVELPKEYTLKDNEDNSSTLNCCPDNIDVTLEGRTLYKDGSWNTLCLPFNVTLADSPLAGDGLEARVLSASSELDGEGTLTLTFEDAPETISAGTPFIVKWNNTGINLVNPVFTDVTINNTTNDVDFTGGSFKGNFNPLEITDSNRDAILLLSSGNRLGYAKTDRTLGSFRAYFDIPGVLSAREIIMDFGDGIGQITGIVETKDLRSRMADSNTYDLQGRKVMNPSKGLYIEYGRLVIIK